MSHTDHNSGSQTPTRPPPSPAVRWLATWFGSGLSPVAPGTAGSLAALPFAWGLAWLGGPLLLFGAALAVFALGVAVSGVYGRSVGRHDSPEIVIDEVAGQWLTLVAVPLDPVAYGLGFAAFRVADITKPWPAGWIDRRVGGGFGVMADDMVAGVYAAVAAGLVVLLWSPSP